MRNYFFPFVFWNRLRRRVKTINWLMITTFGSAINNVFMPCKKLFEAYSFLIVTSF